MAGKEKTHDKLRNKLISVGTLFDILECTVCLDLVKIPFEQCIRGHLLCQECAEPLSCCPSCKSTFSIDGQICMKNLIKVLPRMCRFNGNGCKDIVEPESDHHHHERFCEYRLVMCNLCHEENQAGLLKQHLEKDHPERPLHKFKISNISLRDFEVRTFGTYVFDVTIFALNTLFRTSMKKKSLIELEICFYGFFINKPTNDYFITLKFEKNDVGPRITLKASENSENILEESSMSILRKTVNRCLDEKGCLVIGYEIYAKPK